MTTLKPFQLEGVRQIYKFRGRALLADEMGLGKTIQALSWLTKIPSRRPAIILTVSSMKYTWQAEAALHFDLRAEVLDGNRPPYITSINEDIIILNYNILKSWLPVLIKAGPKVVIIDESQSIKNISAIRSKATLQLCRNVPSVVALSGTPLTNRPIELWSTLRVVRPDLFPDRIKFAWRYCQPRKTPWGWQFNGARRMDELHAILKRECMIRRLKKDCLIDLPSKTRKMIAFKLKDYSEYHKAKTNFLEWLKGKSLAKAKRAKRNPGLTKIGYLLRLVADLKMEWTVKWIQEFFECNPGEKLICLTMHTDVINILHERFKQRALIIDGRVTGIKRKETVRLFQSSKRKDLILGNWKAVVGVTLTAAKNLAALDLPWTPGDLLQGEDRIHRIGQKHQVVISYLIALGTIEEKQLKILRDKSSILEAVLEGKSKRTDFDIFDQLLEEINK